MNSKYSRLQAIKEAAEKSRQERQEQSQQDYRQQDMNDMYIGVKNGVFSASRRVRINQHDYLDETVGFAV